MTAVSNRSVIDESDYQKCGEIMVATTGMFVMKCLHCACNNIFKRLQSFMRHVHQQHSDTIKFQSNAASDLMVFAVEELVNRTLCDVDESEESGVAEDDVKWSGDEDDDEEIVHNRAMKFKSLFQKGKQPNDKDIIGTQGRNKINKKPALANMSILNALEDCDVSMNFVENLDATIVENIDEEEVDEEEKERKDCSKNQEIKDDESFKETTVEDKESTSNRAQHNDDDDMDNGDGDDDDDDCDMNSTLMKRIQLDLDSENEDNIGTHNKDENSKEITEDEDDQNATLTEDVIKATINSSSTSNKTELDSPNKSLKSNNDGEEKTDSSNRTKKGGLKSLLRGLDDLGDVDDLIDNIDDSIMITAKEQEEEDERLQDEENKSSETKLETAKELKESTENHNKMLTKAKGVPQKKVSDLELQLMADLGLDEEDLEDCLNNTYMPENTESAEKSLMVEDKDVTKSEITECLLNDEDDAKPPSNNMKEPKAVITPKAIESKDLQKNNCTTNDSDDISSGNKITPTSRKCRRSNSKTPKNLKKTIEKTAGDEDSPKSSKMSARKEDQKTSPTKKSKGGDIKVTETREPKPKAVITPKAMESKDLQKNNCTTNDSDDISSGNKITPTSRKCRRSNSKTPKNLKKTIEKTAGDEDSPKSSKRSARKEDQKTSPTKKSKGGDIEITETRELVEPSKFEEDLSAENSSTMLCPSPKIEEVHNGNKIGNSLQSLLNRELGEDEDLDMLIDQLETSTSSQANENEKNEDEANNIEKCVEQENPVEEMNVEMDVEKDVMQQKDTLDDLVVDDDIELDDDMAIFNKFIRRKSEYIKENDENNHRPEETEEDQKLNPGEESVQEESKEECDADAKMKFEKSEETTSEQDKEETNETEKSEKKTDVNENAEIDEIEAEDDIENDEEIEHKENDEQIDYKENDEEEIEHKENENKEEGLEKDLEKESTSDENEHKENDEDIEQKENENNEEDLEKDLQKELTSANVHAENEEQQDENNDGIETEKENESVEDPTTQTDPVDESVTQAEHEEEEVITQAEEEENLETVCGETEDLDDFENMLNEDLTKALEKALGEDNVLLNMEDEIVISEKEHNPKEKEDSNQEMEIEEEQLISPPKSNKKSPQNKNKKITSPSLAVTEEPYKGKFSKTNQKARNKQGKPIAGQEDITLKEVNVQPLSPKLTISQIGKCDKESLNPPKPEISDLSNELQENVPLEEKILHKTPSSRRRTQNKATHISKSQIKKEKITPSRCFVNTARGEMTPLKVEDLFLKQSPKTQKKTEEKPQNKVLPKSPEDKHEKSPTQQCKLDLIKAKLLKTPTTINRTSPKSSQYQKSPTTPINQNDQSNITTPQKTRNLSVKVMRCTPTKINSPSEFKSPASPRKQKTPETKTSPKDLKPIPTAANTSLSNAEMNSKFKLPKGITISKVPLATLTNTNTNPNTVDVTPSRSNYCKQNFTENSLQEQIQTTGDKTPSSRRSLIKDDVATTSECSIKGDIAPTESLFLGAPSITESLIKSVPSTTESLLKSVPSSITITKTESTTSFPSRMRARQASIDIVNSRPNATKSPKGGNLDYKSYAVIRSARKKEVLQRMRNIKKQIFKSIGTDVLGQVRTIKSPMVKKSKRSKIQIENVEILPNVQDQVLTPILNTQNLSPQFCNVKSSEPSPKTSLNSPMTAVNSPTTGLKNASESMKEVNIPTPSKEKSPCAKTEKDEVITKISTTPRSVASNKGNYANLKREASSPLLEDQNPPKRLHKSPSQKVDESAAKPPTVELESTQLGLSDSVVDFLQRDLRANRLNVDSLLSEDMPVDDLTPDATINSTDEGAAKEKNSPKLDDKKLHMEKIDEEILKSDEKIEENCPKNIEAHDDNQEPEDNMKNSNSEIPEAAILDELLEQVEEEQKPKLKANEESDDENKNKFKVLKICEDYNDEKDLDLLEHFGLKIIKIDDIENFYTIEEVEEMQGKAKQFSTLCKSWLNVFSSKQAVTDDNFKAFLKSVNDEFRTDISLCDIKRLTNLIIMWYANCYNSKLIEKKVISETTNKYLLMFFYIPKTIKRIYYCEFCEENFNTEHRYYVHRISHTGASHPYRCKHCNMGFNRVHKQKPHEMACLQIKNSNQNQRELRVTAASPKMTTEEKKVATNEKQQQRDLRVTTKLPTATATEKPHNEVKRIPISRRNSNSEHKKLPVRTVYSCAKCEMKFNSESDVKNHMAQCNRSQRRQPKMCTPRPKPKPEPYTKN